MKRLLPLLLAVCMILCACAQNAPAETTAAPTTEPETTFDLDLEETEEAEPVELPESKSWIGLALIAGVLFFILLGAIIFKLSSRRGGRYRRRR